MSTTNRILVALVLVSAGVGYIWWASQSSAPVQRAPDVQAQGAGSGSGGGKQAVAGDGESEDGACGTELTLYQGQELLWRRSVAEVNAMPEAQPIEGSHQASTPALNVLVLAAMAPGTAIVEVVTCKEEVARFPVDRLSADSRSYYISSNRRGAFKLVELHEEVEQTALRDVTRITLKADGKRRIDE